MIDDAERPSGLTRRGFIAQSIKGAAVTAGALAFLPQLSALAAEGQRKRNVLFIAVDDLRPQLGCYGRTQMHTPHLDAFAASGTLFNRAYCQQAVCSPSRSSVMTGCRPDTTKVWDLQTHFRAALPNVITLGQQFKNNGYYVEGVGKIYHGKLKDPQTWSVPWRYTGKVSAPIPKLPPNEYGYFSDENIGIMKKVIADWKAKGKPGARPRGMPAWDDAPAPDTAFGDGINAVYVAEHFQTLKKKSQFFFMACGFYKPHLPFKAPKKYWDLYDPAKINLADNPFAPKGAPPYALHNSGELRSYGGIPKRGKLPDALARKLIHGYYACTSYIDACVGKVLKGLEDSGLADNTLVLLWGDHGWQLGEHGLWCKHTNFETSTRAPLIVRNPGQKTSGAKTDALVEFVDIYPTLCDLCDIPQPDFLEGMSFAPLLDTPNLPWKTAAFSQYPRKVRPGQVKGYLGQVMGYSLRTKRYRFTEWKTWAWKRGKKRKLIPLPDAKDAKWGKVVGMELYDHKLDPEENLNLAHKPENKELVIKLSAMLKAGWRKAMPASR